MSEEKLKEHPGRWILGFRFDDLEDGKSYAPIKPSSLRATQDLIETLESERSQFIPKAWWDRLKDDLGHSEYTGWDVREMMERIERGE